MLKSCPTTISDNALPQDTNQGKLMKSISSRLILVTLLMLSLPSVADRAGLTISNELVEFFYRSNLNGSLALEPSLVHSDVDGIKSDQLAVGIFATHKTPLVSFYLGGQPYYIHNKYIDAHGINLGGGADVELHEKIFAGASLFYAPDILTGGDFDNQIDANIRIGFKVLPNADVYLGYRFIEGERNNYDFEIYDGGFLGFRIEI